MARAERGLGRSARALMWTLRGRRAMARPPAGQKMSKD